MEKKVSRIWPVSDPGTTYFLQIAWEEDISAGFDVMLSDSQSVWTGRGNTFDTLYFTVTLEEAELAHGLALV